MNKEEITQASERFGESYDKEGRGTQMAWAFESGALWVYESLMPIINQANARIAMLEAANQAHLSEMECEAYNL